MPAVPEFHTQWLPTMVLTTGCLEALCGGEEAGKGGACPAWLRARPIKGLSEKNPLATGHPEEPLKCSHTGIPRFSGSEYLWGRAGDAADSEPLLKSMGWMPSTMLGAGQAKDMKMGKGSWGLSVNVLNVW